MKRVDPLSQAELVNCSKLSSSSEKERSKPGPSSTDESASPSLDCTSDSNDDDSPSSPLTDQGHRLPLPRLIAAYLCLCMAYFISYLDLNSTIVSLPTVGNALHAGPSITWAGIAYLLGQTSCQPLYGRISDIVGRKPILLFSVACITLGGVLAGFSSTPLWLYVSRAISGVGSGGISSCVAIIVSDLVSLRSRGKYQGFISLAIGTGAACGPFVAASLIRKGRDGWRWAFWVPAIAAALCFCLLLLLLPAKRVHGSWAEKARLIDWIGVATSVSGVVLIALPVSSGGSLWSWSSPLVIATLTVGISLLIAFLCIEAFFAKIPIIPLRIFRRRATAVLLFLGLAHDFVWQSTQYFVPLYFQTVCGHSVLETATLVLPFLLAQGISGAASGPVMAKFARYKTILQIGFLFWTIAVALKQLFHQHVPVAVYVVVLAMEGAGVGWVHQPGKYTKLFNYSDRAVATSTRNVMRSLGGVIGVAASSAVYYAVYTRDFMALEVVNDQAEGKGT
ncbi:hypothetical protein PWT90_01917 [Aphanocladium album]|nr:hypothetical protein PWT90_01917 [Aphanocladium album]